MMGLLAVIGFGQQPDSLHASKPASPDSVCFLPWLHVEVETSYGWFWQKSKGIAYVTASKDSKQLIKAGRLCVRLMAHDTTIKRVDKADSIVVIEKKWGIAIPKRTAYVAAWTEDPVMDTLRVEMAP
jgi:hypothetical protein